MSNCGKIGALLLVVLAGCTSVPQQQSSKEEVVVPEKETVVVAEPTIIVPAKPMAATPVPTPKPVFPARIAPVTNRTAETWVALDSWSQLNGFGNLKRLTPDAFPVYSFSNTNGTMSLRIGSHLANWNGMEYRLGFAPILSNGRPYVHMLDLQKNLEPLLNRITLPWSTNRIIVIDPGHGGTDAGTKSIYNGQLEKDYTLDWAIRLHNLLVSKGFTVFLTRTNDTMLPLTDRVAFAEKHKADLFLSLHFNSAHPDNSQVGLETYCLTPTGMPSNLTRGYKDDLNLVFPNNYYDRQNFQYAVRFHRSLLKVNGRADRGVRRARFLGVLQNQNRPAVLLEGGYLSNPAEARRVADPAYRQKLAEALTDALLEDAEPTLNLASQNSTNTTTASGTNQITEKAN